MKILITGASGYVGAKIHKYLQKAGLDVIGTYLSTKLFDELIYCNLTSQSEVTNLFFKYKPDVVLHIAANASNGSCEDNPEKANELNVNATKYLVEEARKNNSKFIFISSFAAYNPKGIYGKTKVNAEELVSSLKQFMILRPSLVVGLSPNITNDRPFNRFIKDIENNKVEVEYDNSWEFNVTFLSHLSEVCLNIIKEDKYKNIVVPVATNSITSRYKLAKDILTPFKIKVNPVDKDARSSEPEIDWGMYSRLNLPTRSYEEGISEIISDLQYMKNKKNIIQKTANMVKEKFTGEGSGHDWWHIYRVWKTARTIAEGENAESFIVELGALLHDIADYKFHDGDEEIGGEVTREWLESLGVDSESIDRVVHIVDNVSFKGGADQNKMKSNEGKIVQDADRLDGIGAIGIARCFAYGGHKGHEIYNPEIKPKLNMTKEEYKSHKGTQINHFYEKLLLLKDLMNTETGKEIAEKRHEFMEKYLEEFFAEWDGKK